MTYAEVTAIHVADTSVFPANSTLPSKSCPALISPTPAGVPVMIMSPSSRVVKVCSSLIICTGVYIIRLIPPACRCSPSTFSCKDRPSMSFGRVTNALNSAAPSKALALSQGNPFAFNVD